MPHTLRKLMHYTARSSIAVVSWLVLMVVLMCIPGLIEVGGDTITMTSPIPIVIPIAVAVIIFFLLKKPLNNSKHFYNPDTLISYVNYENSQHSSIETELMAIDFMDGLSFEYWCADLLISLGYTSVEVTRGSGDQGVDVLAQKDGIKYAIQCKCYSSNLGNTPVQEINTGKVIYRCHVGVVMTNRYFTHGAKEAAEATGVLLWDRDWLANGLKNRCSSNSIIKETNNKTAAERSVNADNSYNKDNILFSAAVDAIMTSRRATVSVIQRKLKLGYAQAARLMDMMELHGIVGPFQGSKPRDILISPDQRTLIIPSLVTNNCRHSEEDNHAPEQASVDNQFIAEAQWHATRSDNDY